MTRDIDEHSDDQNLEPIPESEAAEEQLADEAEQRQEMEDREHREGWPV